MVAHGLGVLPARCKGCRPDKGFDLLLADRLLGETADAASALDTILKFHGSILLMLTEKMADTQ
jgi:hypothetical protein